MNPSVKRSGGRFFALVSCCAAWSICCCSCSAILDGLVDGAADRRAEKRYERGGATPREAKQRVFEDEFFKDVGGRP
jgi:hypothetical protein